VTPHPEEIAALLTLPPAVRQALAGCEGPGWACYRNRLNPERLIDRPFWTLDEARQDERRHRWETPADGWAWLPNDSAAILTVARELGAFCPTLYCAAPGFCARAINVTDDDKFDRYPTARLAALRLLAEVAAATP
jgi:hypothetical protein